MLLRYHGVPCEEKVSIARPTDEKRKAGHKDGIRSVVDRSSLDPEEMQVSSTRLVTNRAYY